MQHISIRIINEEHASVRSKPSQNPGSDLEILDRATSWACGASPSRTGSPRVSIPKWKCSQDERLDLEISKITACA
jgi:hypothetical protein